MNGRDLPALHSLVAFEAAARHRSFKFAAEEIGVTPSAVSQRIRNLEDRLQIRLFDRLNRGIEITAAGRRYLSDVQRVLSELADVTNRFRGLKADPIAVAMNIIVAQEMVIPNLARLAKRQPGLSVDVRTRTSMKSFSPEAARAESLDAGIRIGSGPWPGFEHRAIGRLVAVPLCAPALLPFIRDWDDLHRQTLYCAASRRTEAMEALKHPATGRYHTSIESFMTLSEAVRAVEVGLGVMCGIMPVMANLVGEGHLAVALDVQRNTRESLIFLAPEGHPRADGLHGVYDWLVDCYRRLPRRTPAPSAVPA